MRSRHDKEFLEGFLRKLIERLPHGAGSQLPKPPAHASGLTRQVALVLEAVQFNPFSIDDKVDVSAHALRAERDRWHALLPIGTGEMREPLSREEFCCRLRENLEIEGALDIV